MKKSLLVLSLIAALAACGGDNDDNDAGATGTSGTGNNPSGNAGNDTGAGATSPFGANAPGSPQLLGTQQLLLTAYSDGQAEIQLSQLALQRSANASVRAYAEQMIRDHTAVNAEVTRLAAAQSVTLQTQPTAEQQATLARMTALSGEAFDRAYMEMNVAVHAKDMVQMRMQSTQAATAEIRQLASVLYPALKLHHARAEEINGLLNPGAFLVTAYLDGLKEVRASELAVRNADRAEVRAFAQRMTDEHTAMNAQLTQLAQSKGIALPADLTPERQAVVADLARFPAVNLDKAYMDMNVVAHTKGVSAFRTQAEQGREADIRALAAASLPHMQDHLANAATLNQSLRPNMLYGAYQGSAAIDRLAALARMRTTNAAVLGFLSEVQGDQGTGGAAMIGLAQQRTIALPVEPSAQELQALGDLMMRSGADFDRALMAAVVTVLNAQATALGATDVTLADEGLRNFGQLRLAAVQAQLQSAQRVQAQLGTQ